MALPANIGVLNDDGTVTYIICVKDGDIKNVGKILYNNYNTIEKIKNLISNGNMGYIFPEIENCFFIDKFVGQDIQNYKCDNIIEYSKTRSKAEHIYLYSKQDGWMIIYESLIEFLPIEKIKWKIY